MTFVFFKQVTIFERPSLTYNGKVSLLHNNTLFNFKIFVRFVGGEKKLSPYITPYMKGITGGVICSRVDDFTPLKSVSQCKNTVNIEAKKILVGDLASLRGKDSHFYLKGFHLATDRLGIKKPAFKELIFSSMASLDPNSDPLTCIIDSSESSTSNIALIDKCLSQHITASIINEGKKTVDLEALKIKGQHLTSYTNYVITKGLESQYPNIIRKTPDFALIFNTSIYYGVADGYAPIGTDHNSIFKSISSKLKIYPYCKIYINTMYLDSDVKVSLKKLVNLSDIQDKVIFVDPLSDSNWKPILRPETSLQPELAKM
jgi:hypothetical protein